MQVKSAEYIISSPSIHKCPPADRAEYAFIGRSNVGKSSLINRLTNKKKLALTSSTPGKTIMINHFGINGNKMYWVDLPGYGYAKRSKKMVKQLETMIYTYLKQRENLLTTFVLIDSRHEPQSIDLRFIGWCGENQVPIAIVFTKTDKQGKEKTLAHIHRFQDLLFQEWEELPPVFLTSAKTGEGLDDVLGFIGYTNQFFTQKD